MKHDNFQGYGSLKQWYWGMRSDICVAGSNVVTLGTVYVSPFTQDSTMCMRPLDIRFKFSYQMIDPSEENSWVLSLNIGVYKMLKGTGGTAGTLEKVPGSVVYQWAGVGSAGPTTLYDSTGSISVTTLNISPITDGALYIAFLWNVVWSDIGSASLITSYGNTVSSGTWLYGTSGSTGQSTLPQTIAAMGGTAKVFQEHWITEY